MRSVGTGDDHRMRPQTHRGGPGPGPHLSSTSISLCATWGPVLTFWVSWYHCQLTPCTQTPSRLWVSFVWSRVPLNGGRKTLQGSVSCMRVCSVGPFCEDTQPLLHSWGLDGEPAHPERRPRLASRPLTSAFCAPALGRSCSCKSRGTLVSCSCVHRGRCGPRASTTDSRRRLVSFQTLFPLP